MKPEGPRQAVLSPEGSHQGGTEPGDPEKGDQFFWDPIKVRDLIPGAQPEKGPVTGEEFGLVPATLAHFQDKN